jgi:hypothetical protein
VTLKSNLQNGDLEHWMSGRPVPINAVPVRARWAVRLWLDFLTEPESGFRRERPQLLLRALALLVARTERMDRLTPYERDLIKEILCWIPCGIL